MGGEKMLAQVVVDVPTMQTNQLYTYTIPTDLIKYVVPGMRVAVPFGKGKRQVQGFVMKVLADNHAVYFRICVAYGRFGGVCFQQLDIVALIFLFALQFFFRNFTDFTFQCQIKGIAQNQAQSFFFGGVADTGRADKLKIAVFVVFIKTHCS